ncbi:MAG: phosphatidate cytidylyltransferase [Sphingomonas sp.]
MVGLVLALGAVTAILLGGASLWVVMSAVGIGMVGEWGKLIDLPSRLVRLMQFTLGVPLAVMAPRPLGAGAEYFTLGLLIGAALFALAATRRPWAAAGILYVGLPVLGLLLIRDQPRGLLFCFWTFMLVWACDIGAYFAGRAIGGARLAPVISPNKTWSGLLGGVLGAALLGAVFHHYYGLPWRLTLATPALALVAQAGDLFESWLKRRAGVKDSGTLLPGHGGLLDRLDGLAPVAPIAAFLVMLPQVRGFWA